MAITYTQVQKDAILTKLPQELKDALFSLETADAILEICENAGIMDERANKISELAGDVLLGLLLPQDFSGALEKNLGLSAQDAQAIARIMNRTVFYPVKPALEQIHRMEIEVSAKIVTPEPRKSGEESKEQGPPQKPSGEDRYREPLE
ncbi:MAG: hypothetical protein HY482_00980 [Candidatus Wildermuthbacteria bacterium]|nr:hypothetical protein [Candidatus Wildermuthbacteria bacterium]